MGKPYRILSIDGGGIRGALSVALLQALAGTPGLEGWLSRVDLVAGTSTGGLIALGLAKGLSLEVLLDLYQKRGRRIFQTPPAERILEKVDPTKALDKLFYADYESESLAQELKDVLGETTRLGDLSKRVLVTAFDLDNADEVSLEIAAPDPAGRAVARERLEAKRHWKPKVFHNLPGTDSDAGVLAYKAGLYTTAAPTYFPAAEGFVDGGVFASNPAMCALAQSRDLRNASEHRPALEDVRLFSLGTGFSLQYQPGLTLDWGYVPWAVPLVSIMMDGVSGIADYQCGQLLGDAYARLAPTFPPGKRIALDAVDDVPWMLEFARKIAEGTLEGSGAQDRVAADNVAQYRQAVAFLRSRWMAD